MRITERLLFSCLLQGVVCRDFSISLPDSLKTLSGSCVLIPCTFDIPENYEGDLTDTAKGIWFKDQSSSDDNKVFDSSTPDINEIRGEIIGDLTVKNCTTVLYDFSQKHSGEFIFRLEGLNGLKYSFSMKKVQVTATDDPPKVSLRPDKVEVMEGESVRFNCSAEASCPSLGPMLTWSPRLNMSEEKLQEKISQITHMTSVLTFTATPMHHGETITCTATYQLKNNQTNTSAHSATLSVLYSPKNTSVSVSPSGRVLEGSSVTLTCSSDANPAVHNYTWYRVRGTEMEFIVTGQNLTFNKTDPTHSGQYRCEAQNAHGVGNATAQLDIQYSPRNTSVSVSPSGRVLEGSSVILTCSSDANPAVHNYTWYRVRGTEMEFIVTGQNLTFNKTDPTHSGQYRCEAQNAHGVGNSTRINVDVKFSPQISLSSGCNRTEAEIHCVCESYGNPSTRTTWYLSGQLVTVSSHTIIREKPLGNMGLRSSLSIHQSQKDTPTVLCHSTNNLGSSSLQFTWVPVIQNLQGLHAMSFLIGASAGVACMILLCFMVQVYTRRQQQINCPRQQEDSSDLILIDAAALQEEESLYANNPMLSGTQEPRGPGIPGSDSESLHYATVDFIRHQHQKAPLGPSEIRGASSRTPEYAAIRHRFTKEIAKAREGQKETGTTDLVMDAPSTTACEVLMESDDKTKEQEELMGAEPADRNSGDHQAVAMETDGASTHRP